MDWDRYKALCDTPDVCSRWLLDQTLELIDDAVLAERLRHGARDRQIAKPDDHRGGDETDMFHMSLTLDEVRALRQRVEAAQAAGETTSGTRSRGLGGFIETWQEYERFLASGGGSSD